MTVSGTPPRVTHLALERRGLSGTLPPALGGLGALTDLHLSGNALTGAIPAELGTLTLTDVTLSGNLLTGCVPRSLRAAASHDLDRLGLESCPLQPTTLTYDTYDTTGAMTTPGSYAFLMPDGDDGTSAATTHDEIIRDTATRLLVHPRDPDAAAFYATIEPGDIVEWFPVEHERCWQRYRVTGVLPDPPGELPRRLFAIEWLPGGLVKWCSGPINDGQLVTVEMKWSPPAARPGDDGIPVMLRYQPVEGAGTYRLSPDAELLIDLPPDLRLVRFTGFLLGSGGLTAGLRDVGSGSELWLALTGLTETGGTELGRTITPEGQALGVGALFDAIAASARLSE